jgi:Na+-translocating ferredoxin:NAD+ oxidoreductase RnfG subunit
MTVQGKIIWLAPVALACGVASGHAVTYLNVEQAQQAIFPGARLTSLPLKLTDAQRQAIQKSSDVRVRQTELKIWQVEGGGWFIVDEVVGKHEFITYAVGLNADGSVKQIEVMDYRETYGGQVREAKWRGQFTGKKFGAKLKLDQDIENISGATLSSRHIAEGVRRLLATHEYALKK